MNIQHSFSCDICSGRYKLEHRDLDYHNLCPKHRAMFSARPLLSEKDFSGFSPAPFVGHYNYPDVNIGILSTPESARDHDTFDNPRLWASNNYGIEPIAELRTSLVNSRFRGDRFLDIAQEVAMASKPVDLEISLEDKPRFSVSMGNYNAPTGPNANLIDAEITANPKIDRQVDKVVSDSDLKAAKGVTYLYGRGFDENFLSRLLSVGTLGIDRKIVPTRWSITAVDDMLGKDILKSVRDYQPADYSFFFGGYLGNYYAILFFPEVWSYELFEMEGKPAKELKYMTDHEGYGGRKEYAFQTAGGYYTVRLAILEKLNIMKRQASCLALRFITDEYTLPLGVWVTREAARRSLAEKPMRFASKELLLQYVQSFVVKKFGINAGELYTRSVLLNQIREQRKISEFYP